MVIRLLCPLPRHLIWLPLSSLLFFPCCPASAADQLSRPQAAVSPQQTLSEADLWQAAETAQAAGEPEQASWLWADFHRRFRDSEKAEEALWRAARLRLEGAAARPDGDWEGVRDLFRLFTTEYPQSSHYEEAYLELGLAHFQMHFYREALIYLKLFSDRFPESSLKPKARYWQGRTLVEVGRPDEAEQVYKELKTTADQHIRIRSQEALADLYFVTDRFQAALALYERLLQEFAPHTEEHVEIIRKLGLTHCRLGHEVSCQTHLYRYLNVVEDSPHLAEVLFELGESSWQAGRRDTALLLFTRASAKAETGERAAVLSRFRLALDQGRREDNPPPWQKPGDSGETGGDEPYQAVLDAYAREPIAQEARHALLRRLMSRGESEPAMLLAKNYLNSSRGDTGQREEVASILGGLLADRVEELLQAKEYRQVCDLYQKEHRYISLYKKGRLLYLAGQAFEALGLYDQAAIIFYRALSGELTPEEKSDLYVRRARVYLVKGDFEAAERLLIYLRELYAGREEMGEVLYLSGRLREAQGKTTAAASFYAGACGSAAADRAALSCRAEAQLLLQLGRVSEAAAALARSLQQGRMRPEDLQQGFGDLGDAWQLQGQSERAVAAYRAALGKEMPQKSEEAQRVNLRLADLYLRLGRPGEGVGHFEKARGGPDPLLARSAEEGLQLAGIERGMAELRSLDIPVEAP